MYRIFLNRRFMLIPIIIVASILVITGLSLVVVHKEKLRTLKKTTDKFYLEAYLYKLQ